MKSKSIFDLQAGEKDIQELKEIKDNSCSIELRRICINPIKDDEPVYDNYIETI
jgi:hypothetical protein